MGHDVGDPSMSLAIRASRRNALLGAGGLAGLALATAIGLPTLVQAEEGDQGDDQNGGHAMGGHAFAVKGSAHGGAAFSGLLKFTNFAVQQGTSGNQVVSTGVLSGRFVDSSGREIARVDQAAFTAPVNNVDPPPNACQILNLTLGPLTLNLLGLVVDIPNPIVINIFAIPGAGNLLGNLLCAVANLLNGNPLSSLLGNLGALQQLVGLLNQIIGVLNGL